MVLQFSVLDGRRHDRASFCSGVAPLDDYLQRQAAQHHRDGIATTHVLTDDAQPSCILGYCTLSAAQLHLHELQDGDRKRLPAYPVPAMRMGRLAVSQTAQGQRLGSLLLGHAVNLALSLRQTLGVRVLVVDAKSDGAAAFYLGHGFRPTSESGLTLYLPLPGR